jgi:hypothetical protein
MTYFNPFASVPRRISSCGVKGSSSIAVVAAGSATDDSVCIARSHRPGPPFVDDAFARTTRAHRRPRVARFVVVAVRPRRRCGVTIPRAFALARALAETRDAMSIRPCARAFVGSSDRRDRRRRSARDAGAGVTPRTAEGRTIDSTPPLDRWTLGGRASRGLGARSIDRRAMVREKTKSPSTTARRHFATTRAASDV